MSFVRSSASKPLTTIGSPAASVPCKSCTEYDAIGDPPLEDGGDHDAFTLKSSLTETVGGSGVEGFAAAGITGFSAAFPNKDHAPSVDRTFTVYGMLYSRPTNVYSSWLEAMVGEVLIGTIPIES